jgi:hypothetical protein
MNELLVGMSIGAVVMLVLGWLHAHKQAHEAQDAAIAELQEQVAGLMGEIENKGEQK